MTIAQAFNEIAVAQGGTAAKSGAITAAIDALNDALAGSDQPQAKTIEQAVRLLGEHIGGGGASIGDMTPMPFRLDQEPIVDHGISLNDPISIEGIEIGGKTVVDWTVGVRLSDAPIGATAVRPVDEGFTMSAYIVTVDLSGRTDKITAVEPVSMPVTVSSEEYEGDTQYLARWTVIENDDEYVEGDHVRALFAYSPEWA